MNQNSTGLSTFYSKLGISDNQLATTVAYAIVEDFRINLNAIAGFPQILVKPIRDAKNNLEHFAIELFWQPKNITVSFTIEVEQAQQEVKFFNENKKVTPKFMRFIQDKIHEFEVLNK